MPRLIGPILLLFFCLSNAATAQIEAPDFLCLRADTLVWTPATNDCGPFQSYDIFFSTSPTGPFTLLQSITDPNQTDFNHENPTGELRFYYLQTSADCPGQTQLSSDTLDNRSPEISPIRSVSVDGTDVVLRWQPSPSPETSGYLVYRETNLGPEIIATVGLTDTYTDPDANPDEQSETYFVNAIDACGNTSLFDLPHSTMFIESELRDCDPNVYLSWNAYENWPAGVETYRIFASTDNGATFELAGETTATDFAYPDGDDGETVLLYVEAVERDGAARANSNEVSQTLDIVQPNREFAVLGVDMVTDPTTSEQAPAVRIAWEGQAEQVDFQLFRVIGADTTLALAIDPATTPSPITLNDPAAELEMPVGYFARTTDVCGNGYRSTFGRSILLRGETDGTSQNLLGWEGFFLENSVLLGYELFAAAEGDGFGAPIATFSPGESLHSEALDVSAPENAVRCYRVEAFGRVQTPDGTEFPFRVGSNVVCVRQPVKVFFPNAFTPDGRNPVFAPVASNLDGLDYVLRIFDRNGAQLFETTDIFDGWDGRFANGTGAPAGVYVYRMELRQPDGTAQRQEGALVLLR